MFKSFLIKLYLLTIVVCGTVAIITSCSDDDDPIPVTGVTLPETILLFEGQKQTLKPTITPIDATNKTVTWLSGDTNVATINEQGEVEAKSAGTTLITVTTQEGGKTATTEVTVHKNLVSVTGVSLNKVTLPLLIGEKELLIATIIPAEASIKTVTWTSENPAVATVNEQGEVQALSIGTTIITVTTLDGEKTDQCLVEVDASNFTVKFQTNGAGEIDDVVVDKGKTLPEPQTPVRPGGVSEGLYLGEIDVTQGEYIFDGWYTDETFQNKYDFNTPVTTDFTLYAKWNSNGDIPVPIDVQSVAGNTLFEKSYNYVNGLELSTPTTYTYVLESDITNPVFSDYFRNINATFLIVGKGEERKISKSLGTNLFSLNDGTIILGDKITITGTYSGSGYPVYLLGTSRVILRDGAKITGIKGEVCAVYISSGDARFIMEGGEISNNTIERNTGVASGAVCGIWGKFYMEGGIISGNRVKKNDSSHNIGGAVSMYNNQHFYKTGGIIEGNSAEINFAGQPIRTTGQQVFVGDTNDQNRWWKVDNNLGENDNLTSEDTSNPLWVKVTL